MAVLNRGDLRYLCRVLQVVTLKGPSISMGVPYIHAGSNASVSVPVQLSGPNMLPVSAGVSISQRALTQGAGTFMMTLPQHRKDHQCQVLTGSARRE